MAPFFLCLEASKSITPALVLSKFLKMYEEMAQNIEGDPWASVSAWAAEPSRGEWEIRSGVNFMQFVDCLGVSFMIICASITFHVQITSLSIIVAATKCTAYI